MMPGMRSFARSSNRSPCPCNPTGHLQERQKRVRTPSSRRHLLHEITPPIRLRQDSKTRQWPKEIRHTASLYVPTMEGVFWLLLALFLLFLRAFNLVTLIASFMLGIFLLNFFSILWRRGFNQIQVRRRWSQPLVVGKPCIVKLQVTNTGKRGQSGLLIVDQGVWHEFRFGIPYLQPGQSVVLTYQLNLPRRGCYRLHQVQISTGYPFALFRRTRTILLVDDILVLPKLGQLHRSRLKYLLHARSQATPLPRRQISRRTAVPADFYGVREFRPGDSPRWIHWRTTARMNELMVREFEETPLDHLIVILEAWLPEPAAKMYSKWETVRADHRRELEALAKLDARGRQLMSKRLQTTEQLDMPFREALDRLEQAVSCAATLCWTWHQQANSQLLLAIADQKASVPGLATGHRGAIPLLEHLALVEGGPEPDTNALIDQLSRSELPNGPILVISPRASSLAQALHAALRRPVALLNMAESHTVDFFETSAHALLP